MPLLNILRANRIEEPLVQKQLKLLVLLCHFLSAFTALGMPLFLPRMLAFIDPLLPEYWIGILFVTPGICTALVASRWGRFSDKYGKRTSLLRAQLGLSLGFLVSGFADSVAVFAFGLIIQGACGGTLAASNAYLSTMQSGEKLAQSLNLTQLSARLALLCAPVILGMFTQITEPLVLYRYLALLPLFAFLIACFLPGDSIEKVKVKTSTTKARWSRQLTLIISLQFLFSFSMVVTFPYFLQFSQNLGQYNDSVIGLFYGLPHLVYLALFLFMKNLPWSARQQVSVGMLALSITCVGHNFVTNLMTLLIVRVLFGVAVILTYNGIHRLLSEHLISSCSGFIFGRFDASGKWAGVAGGVAAGLLVTLTNPSATFIAAAVSSVAGVFLLIKQGENFTNDGINNCK